VHDFMPKEIVRVAVIGIDIGKTRLDLAWHDTVI